MAQIASERSESVAVANPGPLGLSAFALTTFVLSATNAGLISTSFRSGDCRRPGPLLWRYRPDTGSDVGIQKWEYLRGNSLHFLRSLLDGSRLQHPE